MAKAQVRPADRGAVIAVSSWLWDRGQTALWLTVTVGLLVDLAWMMTAVAADVEGAGVTVHIVSDPPPDQIVPGHGLVQVTLAASWQGNLLDHGQLTMRLLAPQRSGGLLAASSPVEGTELLGLASALRQGRFSFEYLFPLRGIYYFELKLSPVPGGEDFPPTTLRRAFRVHGEPPPGRWRWLLMGGLFVLGACLGVILSRRTTDRTTPLAVVGLVTLFGLWQVGILVSPAFVRADHPSTGQIDFPRGPQVIKGHDGWELVVRPTPVQARVGESWQLAILLNNGGRVFSQPTEVALNVYQLRDDKPILRTQVVAPTGFVAQRLQLFDSAPHTCTVTARPLGITGAEAGELTAVLGVDVAAQPPSLRGMLRPLAILGGMLGGGLVAGFLITRIGKEGSRA